MRGVEGTETNLFAPLSSPERYPIMHIMSASMHA